MVFNPDPETGTLCERQVLFNRQLEKIATIESPYKIYMEPNNYIMSNDYSRNVTFGNVEDQICFLEVAIFNEGPDRFSYTVWFNSTEPLLVPKWREIRKTVNKTLAEYERDIKLAAYGRDTKSNKKIFCSVSANEESIKKQEDYQDNLRCKRFVALIIKDRYDAIYEEINSMINAKFSSKQIADKYGLDEEEVKPYTYVYENQGPQPAEVTVMALLKMMNDDGSSWALKITKRTQLLNEIIYRKEEDLFPNRKTIITSMRPWVFRKREKDKAPQKE